jgi:hypothetical protein
LADGDAITSNEAIQMFFTFIRLSCMNSNHDLLNQIIRAAIVPQEIDVEVKGLEPLAITV